MKCCFIGHRDCSGIENKVYIKIQELLNSGITEFYSGGMGDFDKLCEKYVKLLGGKIMFVPYSLKQIKDSDKLWYDDIVCPLGNKAYSKYDIPNRNRWLVNHCDICLCCVYKNGGAKFTLEYAIKEHKKIINLFKD